MVYLVPISSWFHQTFNYFSEGAGGAKLTNKFEMSIGTERPSTSWLLMATEVNPQSILYLFYLWNHPLRIKFVGYNLYKITSFERVINLGNCEF